MNVLTGRTTVGSASAVFLMLATAVLWSLGGLLIKLVNCHPLAISGFRSLIACVFLLILIGRPHFTWSFQQIAGAVSFSVTVIVFVLATKLTTAANAILLQYAAPIYVSMLGIWLLKEKIRLLDIAAIVLVLAGLILFFLDQISGSGFLGNLFGLISGISFACFFVFTRMDRTGPVLETILLGNMITALIGVPFISAGFPDATGLGALLLLGIVQLGIPYVLYSIAIRRVTALAAILTCSVEPVLNPLWVLLVMGEKPGPWALIGGLIVLISITARNVITAMAPKKSAPGA
jgi:drug/metabolite transporter (DMT)-like permease